MRRYVVVGRAGLAILVVASLALAPFREAHASPGSRLARWLARPILRLLVHEARARSRSGAVDSTRADDWKRFQFVSPRKPPW